MLLLSWLAGQYTSSHDADDGVPSTVAGWGRTAAADATLTTCPAMSCDGFVRQVRTAPADATLTTCPAMSCDGFVRQVRTALNALALNGKRERLLKSW